jgi:exodeoxyribonuclease VII large subunit
MTSYTVSQIAEYLRNTLTYDPILSDLWVSGEVSNLSRSAAGHAYFTLKDIGAQIKCVMFRGNHSSVLLQDGQDVSAHGRLGFYQVRGDIQFYADFVRPQGVGALHQQFEHLKVKMEAEGLFDTSRKRALPPYPHRIGVVTSEKGVVFHDICSVVRRRYPLAEIILCSASVQGSEAASEIVDALHTFNAKDNVDVIVIARGGGSLEEIWPFNEEVVARAIYASHIPVVSAVGHETDFTIADYVADLRAPTPSVAAEMMVPNIVELYSTITSWAKSSSIFIENSVSTLRQNTVYLHHRLTSLAPDIASKRQKTDNLDTRGQVALANLFHHANERIQGLEGRLSALDPATILARGFAMVTDAHTGKTIVSPGQVTSGDSINITVDGGTFGAEVLKSPESRN